MARKSPLTVLSDDDGEEEDDREGKRRRVEHDSDEDGFHAILVKSEGAEKQPKQKRKLKVFNPVAVKTSLGKLCQKLCACARKSKNTSKSSCFRQFHGGGQEALYQLRLQLSKLSKQDFDNKARGGSAKMFKTHFKSHQTVFSLSHVGFCPLEVVELLKDDSTSNRKRQVLFKKSVCQQAFRSLLGIGSERYTRLKKAAAKGSAAPIDGRTLRRGANQCTQKKSVRKRSLVIEFLTELYHKVSEPMPEAGKLLKNSQEEIQEVEGDDAEGQDAPGKCLQLKRFRRSRGQRPRLAAQLHRGKIQPNVRVLPPGTFTDYLAMLKARHPSESFSLKFFTKDSSQHLIIMMLNLLKCIPEDVTFPYHFIAKIKLLGRVVDFGSCR